MGVSTNLLLIPARRARLVLGLLHPWEGGTSRVSGLGGLMYGWGRRVYRRWWSSLHIAHCSSTLLQLRDPRNAPQVPWLAGVPHEHHFSHAGSLPHSPCLGDGATPTYLAVGEDIPRNRFQNRFMATCCAAM